MQIPAKQISYKGQIGEANGEPVFGLGTIGGLHLVILSKKSGEFETLGTGPHKAIARFIAKKKCPGVKFTSLEKSDALDQSIIDQLAPAYEKITNQLRGE